MQGLTAAEVLDLAEAGHRKNWLDRGLLLLCRAWPEASEQEREELALGERDCKLIRLRAATFGWSLPVYATCPDCEAELEAEFDLAGLPVTDERPETTVSRVETSGRTLTIRTLNSSDLRAAEDSDPAESEEKLLQRCLVSNEEALEVAANPEARSAIASAVLEADPMSKVELAFQCSDCGRSWSEVLDIVDYFWREIETGARRLAWQIHALASAYGWTEGEILRLSPARRNLYLSMLANG